MTVANLNLVTALRKTALRLEKGADYKWTHMGMCNCGHLAQTITNLSRQEIKAYALEKAGEWREQAIEYCSESGYTIDHILGKMIELGLSKEEIAHLERLSDRKILRAIPVERRSLSYRSREDVILYMRTWADLLEEHAPRPDTAKVA